MPRPDDPRNPGASLVYRFAARVAFLLMGVQRWRVDARGMERIPRSGGAVIAANHTSYWDFFLVGRAPYLAWGRPVRILAKEVLFRVPVFGAVMQRAEHIPVHRGSGMAALSSAVEALRRGELVLVLPEQTISQSFELLPFKSGAARMAAEAGVPLIPAVSWGSHRFHTKGRRPRPRWRLPVTVRYGEPLHPGPHDDPVEVTEELRRRVELMLEEAQRDYPDGLPAGAWWVPSRLGGGARDHAEVLRAERERWQRRQQPRESS
jgi:1-acyl-sn-glycerol-3-phosphate acyltransferase